MYRLRADVRQAALVRRFVISLLAMLASAGLAATPTVAASPVSGDRECRPSPLGSRDLYLRGTLNTWSANDNHRFTYRCNRYELVTRAEGLQTFKVGDEDWSADADFGALPERAAATSSWRLAARGKEMQYHFQGVHRLVLTMSTPIPMLRIDNCPEAPLGDAPVFIRGTMNNWAALDDFALQYSCDAYYLNVKLRGKHEFKVGDGGWTPRTTLGGVAGQATALASDTVAVLGRADEGGAGNLSFNFKGEHTLRLAFAGGKPTLQVGPVTFSAPGEKAVTDATALSLRFNSRELLHKSPFGAAPAGTKIDFALESAAGLENAILVIEQRHMEGNQEKLAYEPVIRIPLRRLANGSVDHWTGSHLFAKAGVYGYYFEAAANGKHFVYQNNRDSVFWTREKGSNGVGMVEEMPGNPRQIRRFRHTVFAPDYKVPAWAKDAIYYYIFPERFRNGEPANDPAPGKRTYQDKPIEFHRNWMDRPYKPGSGDGSDDTYNNDFFGGDLAGIIEKLDYIAELGANAIYMTPVFAAASNHKYDTADFLNIDPAFGSNSDFERLTREAEKRGIRVIPDTSLNHTGSDSLYFDRFNKYEGRGAFAGGKVHRDSPYAGWYLFDETQTDPDRQYKGWVDVKDLPELNKSSPDFRRFAYGNPDSVMKFWLDRGAAGWRMDVAPWVPDDFWREWRLAIKRHRPDALTIAETWFEASKYLLGDTFDSTMNYIFRNAVLDYAKGGNAKQLYQNLELIRELYPTQSRYALMNLLSSHDAARSLHVLGHEGDKTPAAQIRTAKQRLRLAVFFQMTYPGSPAIYYGDEVGVTGGEDPYNRAPYPWADRGGHPDQDLLADFKLLTKLRRDLAVLRRGTLEAPLHADDHTIVLLRRLGDTWAVTATNNSESAKTIAVSLPPALGSQQFTDALGKGHFSASGQTLTMTVPALFGVVLLNQPGAGSRKE